MSRTLRRCPLGVLMRAERTKQGISLRSLARRLDNAPSHISNVEVGRVSPSVELLTRIGDVLGLSTRERGAWAAAAGIVPDDLRDALLDAPDRWPEVRALLSRERGAP